MGVRANGAAQQLLFEDVTHADVGTVPFGVTRTLVVERYSAGDIECTLGSRSAGNGELGVRGGGKPDIPEHCTSIPPEPIDVVSASCPNDGCIVAAEDSGDAVILRVTARSATPVATRLEVSVRKHGGSDLWTDSVAIAFAPAKRVALTVERRDLAALSSVLLPGVKLSMPRATVVDDAGKPMSIDSGTLTSKLVGDSIDQDDGYAPLVARKPGTSTLVWDLPGVIHREITLEVAAPADVKTLVVSPQPKRQSDFESVDVDANPVPAVGGLLEAIVVAPNTTTELDVHAQLSDGRFALVALDAPIVEPKVLLDVYGAPDELIVGTNYGTGMGTITLSGAGVTRAIPITVK